MADSEYGMAQSAWSIEHGAFPNSEDGIRNSEGRPSEIEKGISPQYDHPDLRGTRGKHGAEREAQRSI